MLDKLCWVIQRTIVFKTANEVAYCLLTYLFYFVVLILKRAVMKNENNSHQAPKIQIIMDTVTMNSSVVKNFFEDIAL